MDDKELHNLLFSSIQHHNDALLDDLLNGDNGKQLIDKPGDDGNILLHAAVIENDLRCVDCLLKHGADPNVFDTIKARTPLHLAVELGRTEIVKAFLELEHINLDVRDDRNLTCYEIAQFCDNQYLANLIKYRQDEIDQFKNDFYSVMNRACTSNESGLVRELLESYQKKITDKLPRGWSPVKTGKLFARSSLKELINWSSSSWNDVTLLFKAASKGQTEVCKLLIDFGATAKCNENTNYSPLYVAAYGGFKDTVKLLLDSFPALVNEITIEKWTILHACCLQGHWETAKLILTYPYPEKLKRRYVSRSGLYEYYFAFDLNVQDAAGQTVIYLAVSANNDKLLDTLLEFNVEAKLLNPANPSNEAKQSSQKLGTRPNSRDKAVSSTGHARIIPERPKLLANESDNRVRENSQLNKIIRQLRKVDTQDYVPDARDPKTTSDNSKYLICPFEMDTYCDYNSKTALHLAVCQQYHSMATTLLVNGANPNLPILSRDSIKSDYSNSSLDAGLNWLRSSKSTCLKEACRLNDELMCDILIRYGASDNQDNLALQVAATNRNKRLISKFLALKSNEDPEFKINKKCNVEFASRYKQSQISSKSSGNTTTTFSSMFPSAPVMIDWHNLKCIKQIDPEWLIEASLMHNKRLKHPTTSLLAITRLDLSANNLKSVHPVIFRLPSLRELNLSKNRLESLSEYNPRSSLDGDAVIPTSKLIESHRIAMKRSKSTNLSSINLESSNIIDLNEPQEWDLPCLETLDLHDNRLISLPDCLFRLPKLSELDVSSNQIRQLPWSMWTAPSLKEMIASGNLLDDLPKVPFQARASLSPNIILETSDSPTEERSSLTSNQSMSLDKIESSFVSTESFEPTYLQNLSPDKVSSIQLEYSALPVEHLNNWKRRVDLVSNVPNTSDEKNPGDTQSANKITYLNLSHNSFSTIPPVLACIGTDLTRLNLSHNRLVSLGDIRRYPSRLKNIDLSNNQISTWFEHNSNDDNLGYCFNENIDKNASLSKFLHDYSGSSCVHKSHHRLEELRSLNLSHNMLAAIQLTTPDNHELSSSSFSKNVTNKILKDMLLYPNITALDLSFNKLQSVPKGISDLKDLSVLNLSGNVSINSLPAELGLASKLWNLGINGCSLGEPLKSIVESKTYKTMDIIGYLRSILEEAKPYARMKLMLVGLQGIGKTSLLEQMRQEGSSGIRRRAPEHWTKRMGHSNKSNLRNQRGVTLSTVGVDIHDWIFCKRTPRNQPNYGPVAFSTWDFGGQQEFYATHRYFLSKRSMYLVVWRLTDGINGILGIQQWLVNIQSRASGSPVIIVGTHEDMVEGGESGEKVRHLLEETHRRFINVSDHDKCGLPRVVDSIAVSTKTKFNIKNLCNRIYDVVFSLRCPGSTERLLEQKIPATYLYLEEIINWIVHDRQQKKREPVLTYEEYKRVTSEQLKTKYNKIFRDLEPINSREINYNSELQQATRFLHENGVLLHYEDANLRDLYFLDPQWLCDILSHVVTIREINPHVKNGLMKIDDLGSLFKSIDVNLNGGMQSYVVNLLNKFEVALTWNSQYLLIPSLLPNEPSAINNQQDFQVKMGPRVRGRSAVRKFEPNRSKIRAASIEPTRATPSPQASDAKSVFEIEHQPDKTIYRFVLLRYLPAGFLARLQSGILSDPLFEDVCADLHSYFMNITSDDSRLNDVIGSRAGWTCWRNGISLALQHESTINSSGEFNPLAPLLTVQELSTMSKDSALLKQEFKVECAQLSTSDAKTKNQPENSNVEILSSKWCEFDVAQYSNVIMVSVSTWRLRITDQEGKLQFVEPERKSIAKLLANTVDHIDNLLEDWYPSLGTRFAHTIGGNYLVTRVIPCTSCYNQQTSNDQQRLSRYEMRSTSKHQPGKINFSINSSSTAIDVAQNLFPMTGIHCFYVEHCILNAYNIVPNAFSSSNPRVYSLNQAPNIGRPKSPRRGMNCPRHGSLSLSTIAPDIVFDDIMDSYKIDNEQIERCKLIGRGTFGFVFKGSLRSAYPLNQLGLATQEVALKLLQPVDPGPEADSTDASAYKSVRSNWLREPFQSACKSYCTARHEINILQTIRHPNIVLFIGLCLKPLALVLELAPLGCLTDIFKTYKRAGMKIDQYSVQKTVLQVSKALEFLHQQRIIYRDLKAENILVWSFPSPFATRLQDATIELKLADYGISRQALATGIWKGFAGTINFLAPEILRHNGDEEYTEKVDCFSFGMFLYELLTLRPPFKHNEGMKSHLADGERPTLAMRDLIYPNHMIDLMSVCWSQEPHHRPTASQIVSIASTPEFMRLLDVVAIPSSGAEETHLPHCLAVQYLENHDNNLDLWVCGDSLRAKTFGTNQSHWTECRQLIPVDGGTMFVGASTTGMCVVDNKVWLCDSNGNVHILPLEFRLQNYKEQRFSPVGSNRKIEGPSDRILSFPLDFSSKSKDNSTLLVEHMSFVECANCVILLLSSGQLWTCSLETMICQPLDDGSIHFKCFSVQPGVRASGIGSNDSLSTHQSDLHNDRGYRVFCGQANGISWLEVRDGEICRQTILPLAGKMLDLSGERIVEPSQSTEVTFILSSKEHLWTAAGCTVHLWSIKDRCVARKLDCWKLVPCSESLESINIEQYYEQARTSVLSSLVYLNNQLFVGTSHGCFMVVEADSLKPMTVFRPYESDIRILVPTIAKERNTYDEQDARYLVTIGSGYRDLMKRYISSMESLEFNPESEVSVAILWSADYYNF